MIIDIHMHIGAPSGDGLYWSRAFERTAAFFAMKAMVGDLFSPIDEDKIRKHIFTVINSSKKVDKVVLLALDEVYDENGNRRPELTNLFVSNGYIEKISRKNPKILRGYSVHPYRKDVEEALERAFQEKALLIKLIPSSQMFDPSSYRSVKFWRRVADLNLPVLIHTGPEYAIPTSDRSFNKFNHPKYIEPALDEGAIIIAAHCATPYFWVFDLPYEEHFNHLLDMFNKRERMGWRLYADLSALATPFRKPYIKRIKDGIPEDRLIFGSDYPIPISSLGYEIKNKENNPLDLYVDILESQGFNLEIEASSIWENFKNRILH